MTHSALRRCAAAALIAIAAVTGACSSGDSAPPVANVSLTPSRTRMALGSPVELTYRFDVAPNATIPPNYRVFVQVKSADGQTLLWQDDHDPPVPTAQWKPGQKIEYTRTRFVPVVPFLGEAVVEMGLYHDNDPRLPLQGPNAADRESSARAYKVATLQFLPTSENVFIIYKTGWHPEEFAESNPSMSWKWTQRSAVFSVRNPKADVTLYLEYDARPDLFPGQPQQVSVYAGDQLVEKFTADATGAALRKIPVSAAQLGTGDVTDFRLDLDKTFIPAKLPAGGRDTRELGIRVYHTFVEGR